MSDNISLLIIEILTLVACIPMMLHPSARPPLSTSIPIMILSVAGSGVSVYQESPLDTLLYGLAALVFLIVALQRITIDAKKSLPENNDRAPV